ncbi:DUF222 domain-containing protein [Ornithinimicrobium pratense]|uniref:DUF222 domain-containing protein n=1 Tax=Ornithinimicrobium pratense TaxID=2593973 RepID=UPI0017882068|nr:DUF222 domain-containing protein [Ornithinimicrobium pratense]
MSVRRSVMDEVGRPLGVDPVAWDAELEEMLGAVAEEAMAMPSRPVSDEDLAYWAMVAEIELQGTSSEAPQLPGEALSQELVMAARGLARAGLTQDESVRVLDAGVVAGIEAVGGLRLQADVRLVLLALQAHERGLHTEQGLSLVDWLRIRCPWLPSQDATAVHQIIKCALLPSGGPVKHVAFTGAAPLHRCALVSRTLTRIATCVEVDQHEGYAQILADAAADPDLSDGELARACAELIRALLDHPPEAERTAQELRSVTHRALGEGLTRFTIDAPDAAAAVLDGIITSRLAAPVPTAGEDGTDVPDRRSSTQRRFDALLTVINRGLSNPGAPPSTARAAVLLVIPFDPDTGRPSGVAHTPGGLLVGEASAGKLACGGEITPVWVGPGNEPLALGTTSRFATPRPVQSPRRARWALHLPRLHPPAAVVRHPPPAVVVARRAHRH